MTADESSKPIWRHFAGERFAAVEHDVDTDVLVVGAGMFGMMAAYLLAKAGRSVTVVERRAIGSGETGSTSAHLTGITDARLPALVAAYGDDTARAVIEAHLSALDVVEQTVADERIDCGFQRVPAFLMPPLFGDDRRAEADLLRDAAIAARWGIGSAGLVSVPGFQRSGVCFPDQAILHPLRFLAGLARALVNLGCPMYERSEVTACTSDPLTAEVNGRRIRCGYLVVATHVPLTAARSETKAALFQTKLSSSQTYVVAARLPQSSLSPALYWDTTEPYHYIRTYDDAEGRIILVGGEDHRTGQEQNPPARFEALSQGVARLFPEAKLIGRWSGQVVETPDGLPYIGEYGERQLTATGFSGNGLSFAVLAATIVRDTLLGHAPPWAEIFAPQRKPVQGFWRYATNNAAYPYHFVKDRLATLHSHDIDSIPPKSGRIVRIDGRPLAIYRTEDGRLVRRSAVCRHLGCIVRWNSAEGTWDCPCHGARYLPTGEVIAGPAEESLALADD